MGHHHKKTTVPKFLFLAPITNFALNLLGPAFLLTLLSIAIAAASMFCARMMGVGLDYSDSNLRNFAC